MSVLEKNFCSLFMFTRATNTTRFLYKSPRVDLTGVDKVARHFKALFPASVKVPWSRELFQTLSQGTFKELCHGECSIFGQNCALSNTLILLTPQYQKKETNENFTSATNHHLICRISEIMRRHMGRKIVQVCNPFRPSPSVAKKLMVLLFH